MSRLSARDLCAAPPADGTRGIGAPDGVVVRGFALDAGPGEWIALTGANGCGKTTLLLTLAGLWPAAAGEVLLDGRPLRPDAPDLRAQVAVILQDPSCQLVQPSVREELGFAAANLGVPQDEVARSVARWSARLGLSDELERDPQELSAGRQQMALLGAALVARPGILLADEPACHMDADSRALALEVVGEEVGHGLCVIWVTQDAGEVARASRSVAIHCDPRSEGIAESDVEWNRHDPVGSLMELIVAPWRGEMGPSVRTAKPLRIVLPSRGVTSIEGPNGSGKSVLLAAATGLIRLPQVEVRRGDGDWIPPMASTQYPELEIFEEDVADEVVYSSVCRGVARHEALSRASALLDRLGPRTSGLLGRKSWGLSGGEKRMVSLVGAMIAPSSLLALDEPTAGLDPARRSAMMGVVGDMALERSVLIASQDREWLSAISARRYELCVEAGSSAASRSKKTD